MVQRFGLEASWGCPECGAEHETPDLVPDDMRDYVDYADYEKLETETSDLIDSLENDISRLEDENRELREVINRLEAE